ncbi:MAG: cardiolipin synthase [Bacteroidales bacterium]
MKFHIETIEVIILIIYYAIIIRVFFKILLENKHPLKTQSYLLLLVLFPIIGLIIYFYFGVNYRREKLFSRKKVTDQFFIREWIHHFSEKIHENKTLLEKQFNEKYKIPLLLYANEKSVLTKYNKLRILKNGEEKFQHLLQDLRNAQKHIHLEYYMINDDEVGMNIINELCNKSSQGVKVRLIYDAVGSNLKSSTIKKMKSEGIEVFPYLPVRIKKLANTINYRNHRKLVIIDGRIAYLGGINIADHYINGYKKRFWRDTHLKIEGEAVYSIQILFLLNWYFVSKRLVLEDIYLFPKCEIKEECFVSVLGSSPDSDSRSMMEAYFSMITNARNEILISSPYFIPNESIYTALKTAAKSNVKVQLIIPEVSDSYFVHMGSLTFIDALLKAGVEVFLYKKGVIHAKIIIIDKEVCTVGSANMDYRSFEQNAEVNAFIFNKDFSEKLREQFLHDIANSRKILLEEWEKRPFKDKLIGSISRVFSPLL